jgi:hypothetical protein
MGEEINVKRERGNLCEVLLRKYHQMRSLVKLRRRWK